MNKMFTGSSTQNTLRMTDVHMFFAFILIIFKFWWETWTARGGEGEKNRLRPNSGRPQSYRLVIAYILKMNRELLPMFRTLYRFGRVNDTIPSSSSSPYRSKSFLQAAVYPQTIRRGRSSRYLKRNVLKRRSVVKRYRKT